MKTTTQPEVPKFFEASYGQRPSPVPWTHTKEAQIIDNHCVVHIFRGDEAPISIIGPKCLVDAEFIVRCVNTHREMLAGLALAIDVLRSAARLGAKPGLALTDNTAIRSLAEIYARAGGKQ